MQSKDEYHNTAAIYDLLFSRSLRSIRNNICTLISHYKAKDVIDLCCGTGEQLRMLSPKNMLLTGVDLSPAMLTRAREKALQASTIWKRMPASCHCLMQVMTE